MAIRFDGQVVVVTGSGAGLGRAYALEFARRGAAVLVNDLGAGVDGAGSQRSAADAVVDEIRKAGGSAVASYGSVADPTSAEEIIATAVDAFGRVDVLVNNAGILRDRALHNMGDDEWLDVQAVHLSGSFFVTRAAVRVMREQKYGRVVFATSNAGLFGNFGQANYGAAKAGLVGLSRVLSIEGAKYGIASNVVAPVARTRMTEEVLGEHMARMSPESVVPMVIYLGSAQCDRTGRVYSAAGGRYAEIVTSLTPGWVADLPTPEAEDILGALVQIEAQEGYIVPRSVFDELDQIKAALAD